MPLKGDLLAGRIQLLTRYPDNGGIPCLGGVVFVASSKRSWNSFSFKKGIRADASSLNITLRQRGYIGEFHVPAFLC